ncbi:MAG: dTDP-4-dehydrorhamnose reductase [Phycisphaerae bacterium]|nr:dTDP-4-dehydrorhamnose reductase [Phycisphaerae bacterium]
MVPLDRPATMTAPSSKPLLLLGADGMLGRAFVELFQAQQRAFEALTLPRFDLTNTDSIRDTISTRFAAAINCAAFTDVDAAESNQALATQINATGIGQLAINCRLASIPLVHFSTDYVFDGNGRVPYPPSPPPTNSRPVNIYGQSKLRGEELIREVSDDHLIIRTSWLYAPWGKNFVRTIAAAARTKPELKVVNDQRGRPTSAQHLATSTLALLDRRSRGIYHLTDSGDCTWFDFAKEIVRLTGAHCKVTPCTSADFPRPAKRPAYSVLDIAKSEHELGPMPPWQSNLAQVIALLET